MTRSTDFAKIVKEINDAGYEVRRDSFDFWAEDGMKLVKSMRQLPKAYDGYNLQLRNKNGEKVFHVDVDRLDISCAVPVMKEFVEHDVDPTILGKVFQLLTIKEQRQKFMMAVTLSQKEYKATNEALPLAGFVKIADLPSFHGRYRNYVWQWNGRA